jgi:hypothetical protein
VKKAVDPICLDKSNEESGSKQRLDFSISSGEDLKKRVRNIEKQLERLSLTAEKNKLAQNGYRRKERSYSARAVAKPRESLNAHRVSYRANAGPARLHERPLSSASKNLKENLSQFLLNRIVEPNSAKIRRISYKANNGYLALPPPTTNYYNNSPTRIPGLTQKPLLSPYNGLTNHRPSLSRSPTVNSRNRHHAILTAPKMTNKYSPPPKTFQPLLQPISHRKSRTYQKPNNCYRPLQRNSYRKSPIGHIRAISPSKRLKFGPLIEQKLHLSPNVPRSRGRLSSRKSRSRRNLGRVDGFWREEERVSWRVSSRKRFRLSPNLHSGMGRNSLRKL